MNYNLFLIRHAKTEANFKHRFLGKTDQPLCPEGITELRGFMDTGCYPAVDYVFVSSMLRCQQTRELIYADVPFAVVPELAECNFGIFENKNHQELKDSKEYQDWIDSGGKRHFPEGENVAEFKTRCSMGFEKVVTEIIQKRIMKSALVIHGGTIMSVLEKFAGEKSEFYNWKTENCEGYRLLIQDDLWNQIRRIKEITRL